MHSRIPHIEMNYNINYLNSIAIFHAFYCHFFSFDILLCLLILLWPCFNDKRMLMDLLDNLKSNNISLRICDIVSSVFSKNREDLEIHGKCFSLRLLKLILRTSSLPNNDWCSYDMFHLLLFPSIKSQKVKCNI